MVYLVHCVCKKRNKTDKYRKNPLNFSQNKRNVSVGVQKCQHTVSMTLFVTKKNVDVLISCLSWNNKFSANHFICLFCFLLDERGHKTIKHHVARLNSTTKHTLPDRIFIEIQISNYVCELQINSSQMMQRFFLFVAHFKDYYILIDFFKN